MSYFRLAVLVVSAAGLLAVGSLIGRPVDPPASDASAGDPPSQPRDADPTLPPGAVRIGSTHFRHVGWHSRVFPTDSGNTLVVTGEDRPSGSGTWRPASNPRDHAQGLHDAAFRPNGDSSRSPGGTNRGRTAAAGILWLIDTAARKPPHRRSPVPHGRNHQKVDQRRRANVRRIRGRCRVIDAKSGDELFRHKGRINAGTLTVRSMVRWLHSVGTMCTLALGDRRGRRSSPRRGRRDGTHAVRPDGKTLYIGTHGRQVTIWTWRPAGRPGRGRSAT